MLRFYKENSKIISKMFFSQLAIAILGLMLALATVANDTLLLFTSIFASLFYLYLIYSAAWEEGAQDKLRVDGGRAEYRPIKGLLISLTANIPNLVLAALAGIGYVLGRADFSIGWEWASAMYGFASVFARYLQAMYLGLIQRFAPQNPLALFLIIVPTLFVAALAYFRGVRGKRLFKVSKKEEERLRK